MTRETLLNEIVQKINTESKLGLDWKNDLIQWISEQNDSTLEFLNSDGFVYNELNVHTEKSLLEGVGSVTDYHMQAVKLGHKAIAVNDLHVTHSWYNLRSVAKPIKTKSGEVLADPILPVFGCIVNFSHEGVISRLNLLAENTKGYKNLLKLVSKAHTGQSDSDKEPTVSLELLKTHSHGLIALTACQKGLVGTLEAKGSSYEEIRSSVQVLANLFKDSFYLELQDFSVENDDILEDFEIEFINRQNRVNNTTVRIANELNIPLVASNDCFYPEKGGHEVQDYLITIREKDKLSNPDRLRFASKLYYMKDRWEMLYRFRKVPQAVSNTWAIALRCQNIQFQEDYLLPKYPYLPEGESQQDFFRNAVHEGVQKVYSKPSFSQPLLDKFGWTTAEMWAHLLDRAEFEVNVLLNMGFEGYMLIVSWINELARENKIIVGPGRGSAAGSIIALALGITTVCPIRFELLFERFLNPDRIEMPDIDTDYQYERRTELIRLVQEKLGYENVAQIVTFGKMKARAALRDMNRILSNDLTLVDKLAKLVPFGEDLTSAMKVAEFRKIYDSNPLAKRIVDGALKIENRPKNYSVHAAGVILSREPINEHASFQVGKKAICSVIQAEMKAVDGLRLVKQDFLGLRNLSVIGLTAELVKSRTGIILDPEDLPIDDPKTYQLLSEGNSVACFQLESAGMRQLLKDMKIESIDDVVDCIALFRPGVLSVGMHTEYVKNKFNPNSIRYIDNSLAPILSKTRGILIYQEQAMQITNRLAGFTMAEADTVRKAIGKKDLAIMEKMKEKFISGCKTTSNLDVKTSSEIWHLIEVMASYSFNKSHSVAYAFISVGTAYLKANFPIEYMTAAISMASQGKSPKTPLYIEEAKRMGIKVVAPDINLSETDFSIKDESIIFGLRAIRDVGKAGAAIVEERTANGPFKSIVDFRKRTKVNKKVITALIKAGCFDTLGENRFTLEMNLAEILAISPKDSKANKDQMSFLPDFDSVEVDAHSFSRKAAPPTMEQIAEIENEMCGIYITFHPMSPYKEKIYETVDWTAEELLNAPDNSKVKVGGMIKEKKVVTTKKGDEMCILTIDDLTDEFSVVIFPMQYKKLKHLKEKEVVIINGTVQYREKFNGGSSQNSEEDLDVHIDIDEDGEEVKEIEYEVQIIADQVIDIKKASESFVVVEDYISEKQVSGEMNLSDYLTAKGNPFVRLV